MYKDEKILIGLAFIRIFYVGVLFNLKNNGKMQS